MNEQLTRIKRWLESDITVVDLFNPAVFAKYVYELATRDQLTVESATELLDYVLQAWQEQGGDNE